MRFKDIYLYGKRLDAFPTQHSSVGRAEDCSLLYFKCPPVTGSIPVVEILFYF